MDGVVDELGLVKENNLMVVYFPASDRALVFRVVSRANKGREVLNYGPLPLTAGMTLASYDGGVVSVPANGVMPARSYTSRGISFPFIMPDKILDNTDMWFLSKRYRERIYHVIQQVTPAWLRIDVEIPKGVVQQRFQRTAVPLGVEKDFGFTRGRLEIVHFPELYYGYKYGNDTNLPVYTFVRFIYGEYIVEIPDDPQAIAAALSRRMPAYWITMPVHHWDSSIESALRETYGITGFKVYAGYKWDRMIEEIKSLLPNVIRP